MCAFITAFDTVFIPRMISVPVVQGVGSCSGMNGYAMIPARSGYVANAYLIVLLFE